MFARGAIVATAFLAASAALAQNEIPGGFDRSKFSGYKPTDAVLGRMTADRALDVLRELTGEKPKSEEVRGIAGYAPLSFFVEGKVLSVLRPVGEVRQVEVFEDRIELALSRQDRGPTTYYFHELPENLEIVDDYLIQYHFGVPLGGKWYLWCTDGGQFEDNRAGCTRLLADALYVLRKARQSMPTEDERFREAVAKYRALATKPSLPEDVRRFKVQAEFLIQQKRYADAIKIYAEALKVAPWWPDGRFNRALLLGETRRFREAIQEMGRFLALEPDAPDARQAQDSIYRWEAMATMGTGRPAR